MSDIKAKGIHITTDGKGVKLDKPKPKKVTKKAIKKALKKNSHGLDGKTFIELFLISKKVDFVKELQFDEVRKFRFDYAIPRLKTAIEYDGLFSDKSGHTTVTGFTSDADKRNLAQKLGWDVYHYTALNFENIVKDLEDII